MSVGNELGTFLLSDVSSAPVDELVTRFGLWARNSLLHTAMGFVGFFVDLHRPDLRTALLWGLLMYLALQAVQLASPGPPVWLFLDGIFDALCLGAGYAAAWWLAMRDLPEGAR